MSPDSTTAWTSNISSGEIVRVDLITGTVVTTTALGAFGSALDVSANGDTLYVTLGFDNLLVRIDTTTNMEILPRQPTGVFPFGVLGHSNGNAWVMNLGDTNVAEHDGVSGTWIRQFMTGIDPVRVRECPNGDIAVGNASSNSVTIFDPVSGLSRSITGLTSPLDQVGK